MVKAQEFRAHRSFDALDGWRGLCILAIVLMHVRTNLIYSAGSAPMPDWVSWWTLWAQPGYYAMCSLLVVAGYGSMMSLLRSQGDMALGYLCRRARRLLPPYYAVFALMLAVLALLPKRLLLTSDYYPIGGQVWRFDVLASHLLLVHNFFPALYYKIDPVFWFVASQWQVYMIVAFLLVPAWKRHGMIGFLVPAALIGYLPPLLFANVSDWHPWYIMLFALGMGAVLLEREQGSRLALRRDRISWGTVTLSLVGIFAILLILDLILRPGQLSRIKPDPWQLLVYENGTGLTSLTAILFLRSSRPSAIRETIERSLSGKWLRNLGRFSYSLFLLHYPILAATRCACRLLNLSALWTYLAMFGLGIPACLLFSYLFYMIVERRFSPTHLRPERGLSQRPELCT